MNKIVFLFLVLFLFNSSVLSYTGREMTANLNANIDPGIIVDYGKFDSDTSDFLYFNDIELSNVDSLTLSIDEFGKIIFLEEVNLTMDAVNNVVNLSKNVDILSNYVYVDSISLKSFSKPAIILLKDINYVDPLVLRNGEICPESMCSILSYVEDELLFRVQSFSTYYVMERTSFPVSDEGEDSSSSVSSDSIFSYQEFIEDEDELSSFYISNNSVSINSQIGSLVNNTIILENKNNESIEVAILTKDLGDLVKFSDSLIQLGPYEKKEIYFEYYFPNQYSSGLYRGEIIFLSGEQKEVVKVVLNLNKKESLFRLNLILPRFEYTNLDRVSSYIKINYLGEEEEVLAMLYYSIRDLDGNVISFNSEFITISKEIALTKTLRIPYNIKEGDYVFYSGINYNGQSDFGATYFHIYNKSFFDLKIWRVMSFILILILLLILFIIFRFRKIRN